MTNNHPIIPPQELVDQWGEEWHHSKISDTVDLDTYLANQAGQWCADRELEACREWLIGKDLAWTASQLYAARRPRPPSLKEEALERLELAKKYIDVEPILRALKALPE